MKYIGHYMRIRFVRLTFYLMKFISLISVIFLLFRGQLQTQLDKLSTLEFSQNLVLRHNGKHTLLVTVCLVQD
jgi:hypothetical protein